MRMMLDDCSTISIKSELHSNGARFNSDNLMDFALDSNANFGVSSHLVDNSVDHVHRSHLTSNVNTNHAATYSSDNKGENLQSNNLTQSKNHFDHHHHHNNHHHHHHHQQQQQQQPLQLQQQQHQVHHSQQQCVNDEQYFTSDETNSSGYNQSVTPSSSRLSVLHSKPGHQPDLVYSTAATNLNVESSDRQTDMVPSKAHSSDQHNNNMHYSLSNTTKNLSTSSPSNMALNFSHDLLLQTSHHQGQSSLHHHSNDISEPKHNPLANSLDLESGNQLMQSAAAGMNMWKSSMGLGGFKHSSMNEHSFLPATDINSFSSWTHGNNLGHQATPSMTHHILEGQHLIGYQQHNQRPIQLQGQDIVGASLKNQVCAAEQASFMLNSINQVNASQVPSTSHHHTPHHQSSDNIHLRSQSHDHNATSYNLSMNDNQFYNNRSHGNSIKSSVFQQDRSGPSHSSNQNGGQISYHHNAEHLSPQPTTSHHVAGTTSGSSNKNAGTFRCPHCSEMFGMRNLYQSHLKTHSQDKGPKAKFHCELCGHSFSQKTSLNRHMKSHTGERPFPCEVCGKAFSEKERLKIHMRTHTGEKPFSCSICGKSFSQKSTVKRHQTVHTGEKKFKCDCGKGFANRGNLIAHIKTRGSNHFE